MDVMIEDCVLCYPSDKNVILGNEQSLFLMQVKPEIEGAGLIVPRSHKETVFDLTEDEWRFTYRLLIEVKKFIDEKYKPDGYNVGWNCGQVGGQHIFHSHMHVIPRFSDEPMAGKGIRYLFKSDENRKTGFI